jgi:ribosomal protein S18 acetylase RimI-like enzyme
MSNIQIIKARVEDAQSIIEYLDQIGKESDNLTFGEEGIGYTVEDEMKVIQGFEENLNSTMFIALDQNKIVSIGNLSASKRDRTKHVSVLGISVLKDHWKQGIGNQMMKTLIEFAHNAPDTRFIHLEVRSDNNHAIHLYESTGFKKNTTIPKMMFIKDNYYDIDLMILDLDK